MGLVGPGGTSGVAVVGTTPRAHRLSHVVVMVEAGSGEIGNSMEAHQHMPVCMHAGGHSHLAGETYAH